MFFPTGGKNLTCKELADWANDVLGLEEVDEYGEGNKPFEKNMHKNSTIIPGTIRNWLHLCGFKVTETKKGLYTDGHERQDVIKVSFKICSHQTTLNS